MPPRKRKGRRGRKPGSTAQAAAGGGSPRYKFASCHKEDHNKPLFGVSFNPYLSQASEPQYVFATVGSNRASVYECLDDGTLDLLQAYVDENPDEVYYSAAWSHDEQNDRALLAVAGYMGLIRLVRLDSYSNYRTLSGHGNAVNELRFHPFDLALLLSASKDHSLRLWNIDTGVCIAVFAGDRAHRDEVLSVDFSLNGTKVVSCGMDQSVKLWDLHAHELQQRLHEAKTYSKDAEDTQPFPTLLVTGPLNSTSSVHSNYVDCVRWFGDLIFSKSTESEIVLWILGGEPRLDLPEERRTYLGDPITIVRRLPLDNCSIWFVKFDVDPSLNYLVAGNQAGKVMLWDLNNIAESQAPIQILQHPRSTKAVRQVTFSSDTKHIVYVCDDGTIHRWDRVHK